MKRIFIIFLAIMLLSFLPIKNFLSTAWAANFSDVGDHWAKEAINYIADKGLINGYSNGQFKPDQTITRAEMAKIVVTALDLPLSSASFIDVPKTHWANKYIGAAAKVNIVTGYSNGTFRPNQSISRAEVAAILVRAFHLTTNNIAFPSYHFTDIDRSNWAFPFILNLVVNNITNGYTNHTYKPEASISRAEVVTFIARIFDDSFKIGMAPPPSVDTYIPVLCWHNFPTNGKGDSLNTDPKAFEKQLTYLKEQGYQTITVEDLVNGQIPAKPIMLTADDGYLSTYTNAFPILKKLNMKMTVFIIVSSVGETPGQNPHFTWEQAKEMEDSGLVDIESHTFDQHRRINDEIGKEYLVTPFDTETHEDYVNRITNDLALSKSEIESHLNKEVVGFAYPFGVYNDEVEHIAQSIGFKAIFTTNFGVNSLSDLNLMRIKRIGVNGRDSGPALVNKIIDGAYRLNH
ncbi:S-layer homology domain-containing protein [Tuberibacillus calidus]|jgi:peptidoglycan/xylan/chitin deacetylase (PgdA/CDA1 family)|uniref:S-layer homology domain-containing protein n=1 Tax=Tuberibacillus calidus TaxID=340097 RepID=UPI0004089EDE|nr:S-layer homology domain-containing protein [Tuberibacillus calidus]